MASKTDIANMAISHLGIGKEIANLETEQSQEAGACRRFYDLSREAMLTEHDWTFATRFATLALVEAAPTDEWAYSYRYPSKCLKIRRIISGMRQDTLNSEIPYKIVEDAIGYLVYTDEETAEVEYTYDVTDTSFFKANFAFALSFRLAAYVAPRITAGDPFKMKQEMLGQYQLELGTALAKDLNTGVLDKAPESEFIKARS